MKSVRCFMTCAVSVILVAAEEVQLPPAVAREMDNHASRMAKIDQDAEKARSDERARVTKVLDEALKAETKKGNLETAIRIKQLREGLQPKPVSSEDLLGDSAPAAKPVAQGEGPGPFTGPQLGQALSAMFGTWNMANGQTWVIKPGGVFIRQRGEGGESAGTWRSENGRITLIYASGREVPLVRVDANNLVVLRDGGVELGGTRAER